MRVAFALIALALAAACAQQAPRCEAVVTRDISFSNAEMPDHLTLTADGPSCDKAVAQLVIRTGEGHPAWAWTAPLPHAFSAAFGDMTAEGMTGFLERWADVETSSTSAAPDYAELAPRQTTLDPTTYMDVRARDLPMLCHASGTAREVCIFWEPAAGGAGHYFDREMEITEQ